MIQQPEAKGESQSAVGGEDTGRVAASALGAAPAVEVAVGHRTQPHTVGVEAVVTAVAQ